MDDDEVIFQPRLKCSASLAATIHALRGTVPIDRFLAEALSDAILHRIEEMIMQRREAGYKRHVVNSDEFRAAIPMFEFTPTPPEHPTSVVPFGRDLTHPKKGQP